MVRFSRCPNIEWLGQGEHWRVRLGKCLSEQLYFSASAIVHRPLLCCAHCSHRAPVTASSCPGDGSERPSFITVLCDVQFCLLSFSPEGTFSPPPFPLLSSPYLHWEQGVTPAANQPHACPCPDTKSVHIPCLQVSKQGQWGLRARHQALLPSLHRA